MSKPGRLNTREQRRNAVIYQIYPRSFMDSNGDGIGDLAGITSKLDYVQSLGVDGIWLSPIFKSPMCDMGYDVSDYYDIDPIFGSIADADELIAQAHARNLVVLFDIVPCHTSIEHPWFKEHPDWYIWSDGPVPPNNWRSVFGGSAWTYIEELDRSYLHQFYAHQPALNWRKPDVQQAVKDAMKYWLDRGVDGFRIDALQFLVVDELLRDEPVQLNPTVNANCDPEWLQLDHVHTLNQPEVFDQLADITTSMPDALFVAEVYDHVPALKPYTQMMELTFSMALSNVEPDAKLVGEILQQAVDVDGLAWAMSNHDMSRLATRWGRDESRLAALLTLTIPGAAFIYQGDEIGQSDGPGVTPPIDSAGRDMCRHPFPWHANGGFTTGNPWLSECKDRHVNVEAQQSDVTSTLSLYRELIHVRRELSGPLEDLAVDGQVLSFRRGGHVVAINFGESEASGPAAEIIVSTDGDTSPSRLLPRSGYLGRLVDSDRG